MKFNPLRKDLTAHDEDLAVDPGNVLKSDLIGIRGWLAFLMFGFFTRTIIIGISLAEYPQILRDTADELIWPSGAEELMTKILWFEVVEHAVLIALGLVVIALIIIHKKAAKYTALVYMVLALILTGIDLVLFLHVNTAYDLGLDQLVAEATAEIIGAIGYISIWGTYLMTSERVKATLTK